MPSNTSGRLVMISDRRGAADRIVISSDSRCRLESSMENS